MKTEAKSIAVSKIADSDPDVGKTDDADNEVQNRDKPSDMAEKPKQSNRKSRLSQAEAEVNT